VEHLCLWEMLCLLPSYDPRAEQDSFDDQRSRTPVKHREPELVELTSVRAAHAHAVTSVTSEWISAKRWRCPMSQALQTLDTLPSASSPISDYLAIPISSISVGPRRRGLRFDNVASLTDSIKVLGLNTAISVVEGPMGQDGHPTFELVDGNHRLEAFKRLGRSPIPARVLALNSITRQLAEIDANLCRAELTALERSEHLLHRKELYEELHPETRQHVAGAAAANASIGRGDATAKLATASFAADTAVKTGFAGRTIRREISRAKKIDEAVRDRIRHNPEIADKGSELDALASLEPDEQRRVMDLIESKKCKSIAAAKRSLHPSPSAGATPVRTAGFKTTRPTVPMAAIPKSKLDAATSDQGKQGDIRRLHEIVHRIEGTDRNNLIAYLNKLGGTRCDKVAECLQ
jgi:hypothetical protein